MERFCRDLGEKDFVHLYFPKEKVYSGSYSILLFDHLLISTVLILVLYLSMLYS